MAAPSRIALIPARYDATRFPGKLMQKLKDHTVITTTYKATEATELFDEVVVATDSQAIFNEIISHGGRAVMSLGQHESGTDRIAEAAASMNADIILNVQGDTPFISREPLEKLLREFDDPDVQVASLMQTLEEEEQIADPNFVKVCVDMKMNALFFSRSRIPYLRNREARVNYFEHIGVYAFRRQALLDFTLWPVSSLENAEKVECLRFLENGMPIRMVLTSYLGVEIDTPEDLQKAISLL